MRIGICGTHGTGKTSAIAALSKILTTKQIVHAVVDEVAGTAVEHGFPILRDHTVESTLWIMSHGICRELELANRASHVLVDRPIFDALAYLEAALEFRGERLAPTSEALLYGLAENYSPYYDLLIKTVLNPDMPLVNSAHRDVDPMFRERVDQCLLTVIERLSLECVLLDPMSTEEVIQRVADLIASSI